MGRTILQQFCAMKMRLDAKSLEMNLSAIKFLLENGADPYRRCELTQKNSFELAVDHCQADRVSQLLSRVKQIHFHTLAADGKKASKNGAYSYDGIDLDSVVD